MKKNIYFIFAVLFGITLTACNMQHEHTWGEYQYNESEHWRTYTCGHTAPNNNTSHIDDNDDGNCDICNYKISESHTHTWTWYIEDIGHTKAFTCGCPSEEGTNPHFDNDNNNLCDACGYSMLKETPTGTFKLNIIDEQNYIYDKPEKTTMFAPGTTILFHSLPIMDADLVIYVNDAYFENKSLVYISYWTNSSVEYNVTKTEIIDEKVNVYLDVLSPYYQNEDYILMNILVEVDYKADENTELNIIEKIICLKEYQTFEN